MMAKMYEYQGETMTIDQLSHIAPNGISKQALRYRINHGFSVDEAVTKPLGKKVRHKKTALPCGATNPFDCLNCKLKIMPRLRWPAMSGEGVSDYVFKDYKERRE